jgi:hypothetical protein
VPLIAYPKYKISSKISPYGGVLVAHPSNIPKSSPRRIIRGDLISRMKSEKIILKGTKKNRNIPFYLFPARQGACIEIGWLLIC